MSRMKLMSLASLAGGAVVALFFSGHLPLAKSAGSATVRHARTHDVSARLRDVESLLPADGASRAEAHEFSLAPDAEGVLPHPGDTLHPARPIPAGSTRIEQATQGSRPEARLVASFDGLGVGFSGPQGTATLRNPSDNSLAVGRDHIVQVVNSRMAVYTKKGTQFDTTGRVLYGAVETRNVFKDFGGPCELRNNGDAVVRYDQLANRWLIAMPIFTRVPSRATDPAPGRAGEPARSSQRGQPGQPDGAHALVVPRVLPLDSQGIAPPVPQRSANGVRSPADSGTYAMCYAVSTSADPLGAYYRYEFVRPLFPDYPRPAVWPDGYYVPSSTGDEVIQKHACVVDRVRMLAGEDATEQCVIIDGANFLNNADLDGTQLPPVGAPNIMLAAGGTQLKKVMEDDGIYAWSFHVDWKDSSRTRVVGPRKIAVAPYHYLCDGQLTNCVPQPGTDRGLDAQGDKLMSRVVYRRIGGRESIVAVHSVNTEAGGGVRWYEFRIGARRQVALYQQGTYEPGGSFRWMGSPAMDAVGNIGIGYSFGGTPHFAGQRFAARLAGDTKGMLTLREAVLVEGAASQVNTLRWEDYTQTAMDPSDDCTIWYVGDYLRATATSYSSRIGGYQLPGCGTRR